jgi:NAD(P)-dependent dehydrogenase (short-subunit alcohol dehydrogenase family)
MMAMRAVVTGASRGLGLGLARALAKRGDEVHATARSPGDAAALDELARTSRGRVRVHELDVRRDDQARALGAALGSAGVDLLINNAGVGGGYSGLAALNPEEALAAFDTNALGPLRVTRALVDNISAARGKVINVSSTMGSIADNTSGRAYAYRMSKAALNMATRNLAIELAPAGVTVVCVNPGWVKTDLGGPNAPTEIADSVGWILRLADSLELEQTGRFLHAKGYELPW